jgi:predicted extracellular nuclease
VTVGQYNVENLMPTSSHLAAIAAHIADYMRTPDLLFLQEVQDNDGTKNDGVTTANVTLATLTAEIESLSGVSYSYVEIEPEDGKDGGAPGGNIRVAYLYNPAVLSLVPGTAGSSTESVEVLAGGELSLNPGRIDPTNAAFTASRKPLLAAFNVKGAKKPIYAINVHSGSKGGSTSLHGDSRPPLNGGIDDRIAQAEVLAGFIEELLAQDKNARILAAGDFNEFSGVAPQDVFDDILYEVDELAGIKLTERYTYNYDMNSQQVCGI